MPAEPMNYDNIILHRYNMMHHSACLVCVLVHTPSGKRSRFVWTRVWNDRRQVDLTFLCRKP